MTISFLLTMLLCGGKSGFEIGIELHMRRAERLLERFSAAPLRAQPLAHRARVAVGLVEGLEHGARVEAQRGHREEALEAFDGFRVTLGLVKRAGGLEVCEFVGLRGCLMRLSFEPSSMSTSLVRSCGQGAVRDREGGREGAGRGGRGG